MYKKSKHLAVDMLPKTFKGAKCKTSLKLAMSRIKLMRNRKEIQVKQMRRDLAQLLEAGQDQTARIRVEHVIREEKTLSAYELIDIYCELIVARLPIIESQKSCPIDLKEAIASVVFASPRCADIPELMDVRKQFLSKYGKEFVTAALEVRPECGVSRLLVEKLSARAPDGETKVKVMTSIAQEHNVKWEPKSFEDELKKPNEDLLAGPNTFASVNQMPVKYSNISAMPSSMNEPSTRMFQSDAPSKATSYNSSSGPSINTASTSVPSVTKSNSRVSENWEGRSTLQEVNSANHVENGSLNRQNWNMEFKDASSAAQAAAESAERASMAARAAAELARRGSASYNMKDGSEKSEFTQEKDEYVIKESVPMQYNEMKPSQGMQMKMDGRKIDEVPQASSRREAKETYDGHADIPRSSSQSIYHSNEISGRSDHLEINQKVDGRTPDLSQRSISKSEPLVQNYEDNQNEYADYVEEYADYAEEIINENYNKSAGRSSFDDDTAWDSNTWKHANYEEKSGIGARQGSFGNSPPIIFDNYGFDTDDRLLDNFSSQQEEEQSTYLPSKDQWSTKQHSSFVVEDRRSSQQIFETTKPHPTEFVETTEKGYQSPNFDGNTSAAFDDYDSYEDEDVFDKIMREEAMEPSNLPFDQKCLSESLLSAGPNHEANQSYSFQNKEVEEASENYISSVPSDGSEKIHESELGSHDRKPQRSSSSSLSINKSLHDENASGHSIDLEKEIFHSVADEKPKTRGPSRVPSLEAESNDAVRMSALSLDTDDSRDDSGAGLKLGKLTGGFKHKGFPRPPYQKGPLPNNSAPSKQSSVSPPATEMPVSSREKATGSFNSSYQEEYDQEQNPQAYMSKSKASSVHSDFNKEKSSELSYTEGRGCTNDGPSPANSGRVASNIERQTISYQKKESPQTEYKVYKSYNPRAPKQDHKEYGSESYSIPDFPSISPKDNLDSTIPEKTFADPETPKLEVSNQIPVSKTNKESRSNMSFNYSDQDVDKVETLEPRHTHVKLSRRTRALPSQGKRGNLSTFTGQPIVASEMESQPSQSNFTSKPPNTNNMGIYLERRGSSESSQQKLSSEQPPVTHKAEPSKNKELPKSSELAFVDSSGSTKKSSSIEGSSSSKVDSQKKAPHVHPRLPDYDSFAAHFQSLRANRQPQ
ncbi:hypothetical protein J5N97_004838 [Dioscorea zingiberensis]|uniref:IST1-like protein n=1 Tax=Dioscorea zingiberensis TaxID=325984 RepID=A0A9D5D8S2_9LILI|nr:hypothetical protein J5N97_004838 [Dioscorea zingiberensis]